MTLDALSALSDDELALKASSGERDALEQLIQRHASSAVTMAFALLGNHGDALDAAQSALIKVTEELNTQWRGRPFKTCLLTCTRSAAIDLLRQNNSRKKRDYAASAQYIAKDSIMPTDLSEQKESLQILREELAALPDEMAEPLVLYHLEGQSVAQTATQMKLSVDACKQRLSRGREQLRVRLERRGLALITVALLTGLLDQLFSSARVYAAELEPSVIERLTNTALKTVVAGALVGASAALYSSSETATNAGSSNASASTGANSSGGATGSDGPLTITKRIWSMVKQHPLAIEGSLLGTVAVTLIVAASIWVDIAYREDPVMVTPTPSQNSIPNDIIHDSAVQKNITSPAPSLKQSMALNDRTLWIPLHVDPQHGSTDSASFTVKTNQAKVLEINGLLNTKIFTTPVRIKFRCKASGKAEKIFASIFALKIDPGFTPEFSYAKNMAQQGRMCSQTDISSQTETWIELNVTPTELRSFENGKQTDSLAVSMSQVFIGILCKVLNSPEGCTVVIDKVQIEQNIQKPLDTGF